MAKKTPTTAPPVETLAPVQAASEQVVTEQVVTEQAVTEQAVTEQAVTEQAVTEQAVTEQAGATPTKYTVLHPIKVGATTRLREGDEVEMDEFEANGLIALGVLRELKG